MAAKKKARAFGPRGAARKAADTAERLAIKSPDKMPYAQLCAKRVAAWREHVAQIGKSLPEELGTWASDMSVKHGPKVYVWANSLDWIVALLVVRYGEAVEHWPRKFTDRDIQRAVDWRDKDKIPAGVMYSVIVEEV